jgi:hypothetical protein
MGVENCINICYILWVHWIGAYVKNFSVSQQLHVQHVRLLIISKGSYFCLSPYRWTLQTKLLFALQVWIVILIIAAPPIFCIISCFWGCRTSIYHSFSPLLCFACEVKFASRVWIHGWWWSLQLCFLNFRFVFSFFSSSLWMQSISSASQVGSHHIIDHLY